MEGLLVVVYLFIFLFLFCFLVYLVIIIDSIFGGLDFSTSPLATAKIVSIIKAYNQGKGILFDLGSCRGTFASRLKKQLPNLKVYGIDSSKFRTFCSQIKSIFSKHHPKFLTADLFQTDISQADIVYIYLQRDLMPRLQSKLQKELKSKALVVTNTVTFPSWQPVETYITHPAKPEFEKIFVYQNS